MDTLGGFNHGGAREGAGRPKKEQTKMMRVPLGAEFAVKGLLALYRDHNLVSIKEITLIADEAAIELDVSPALMLSFALINGRSTINTQTLISCFKQMNAHILPNEVELRKEILGNA